jgi:hypothetical protein
LVECVKRETNEEICCKVQLFSSPQAYFAGPETEPGPIDIDDEPRPLLVSLQYRASTHTGLFYNVLFAGCLKGEPSLGSDVEAILHLTDGNLRSLAQQPLSIAALERARAIVHSRSPLPPHTTVTLARSPALLARLISEGLQTRWHG